MDGLKGFPQAIETVFPKTTVQLRIAHMVRASLNYVNWKQRRQVAEDLKTIYRAATEAEAEQRRKDFSDKWDGKYPSISALWRRNWLGIVPFFQFPPEIRKIVYTTNAIESLNMSLSKAIKTRGAFPTEDAALKVMYLALRNLAAKWHAVQGWREALNQFAAHLSKTKHQPDRLHKRMDTARGSRIFRVSAAMQPSRSIDIWAFV